MLCEDHPYPQSIDKTTNPTVEPYIDIGAIVIWLQLIIGRADSSAKAAGNCKLNMLLFEGLINSGPLNLV